MVNFNIEHWDESWRRNLLNNFSRLAVELWQVGIEDIFLDGSLVEEKDHPNDIDGYRQTDQGGQVIVIRTEEEYQAALALEPYTAFRMQFLDEIEEYEKNEYHNAGTDSESS